MQKTLIGLTIFCVSIALWQLLVVLAGLPHFILPGPYAVAQTLVSSRVLIFEHALITMAEVLVGLILGSILGVSTALLLLCSNWARRLLEPVMVFSQSIPVFALAPVLTLWLGYGMGSKIFMAVLITYFPVASNFYDGLRQTPVKWLDLAHILEATSFNRVLKIRFPAAVPSLVSGIKLATVYAPIGAVIGEWVGASRGLGYLMLLANGRAKIDLMFAALIVLALFTVLLHVVVSWIADKAAAWAQGQQAYRHT